MNTIIEMNGTSIDLKRLGSISFKERPMQDKRRFTIKLTMMKALEEERMAAERTAPPIGADVSITYPSYSLAARGHSTLIRAWGRYRDWESRARLLQEVERELGIRR